MILELISFHKIMLSLKIMLTNVCTSHVRAKLAD